nr:hypothetical protein [uncultured Tyzzerella sp.]
MNCKYHNNLKATNTCCVCGSWICENCVLEIEGRIYCKECLKNKIRNEKHSDYYKSYSSTSSYTDRRTYKSGFVTFILSFLPGMSQVYLGYTKRGFILFSFFLIGAYIDAFSALVALTYVFSLFDAFRLKGNLERGIYQEDSICDIKKFIKENKFFIAVLSVLVIIPMFIELFEDLLDDFFDIFESIFYHYGIYGYDIENIIKIGVVIIVILAILLYDKSKKSKIKNIDKIDTTNKDE